MTDKANQTSDQGESFVSRFSDLMSTVRHDGALPRSHREQLDIIDQLRNALDRHSNHLSVKDTDFIANSFSIEEIVYESKTTQILRLRNRDLGTNWALKTVPREKCNDLDLVSRIRREAEIGLQLRHSCLLETSTLLRLDDGRPGILQRWQPKCLADLSFEHSLTLEQVKTLIRRIVNGLEAMHAEGYIHCDVSPSNVFLPDEDLSKALLGDFGISLPIGEAYETLGILRAGSPEYSSPEQLAGLPPHPTSDLFSVGEIAKRLLALCQEPPDCRFLEFVEACCQQEVSSRPQSANDAGRLLSKR